MSMGYFLKDEMRPTIASVLATIGPTGTDLCEGVAFLHGYEHEMRPIKACFAVTLGLMPLSAYGERQHEHEQS